MNRTAWLAAGAVMLAASPSFAQFGAMGGMGGGMGGMGGGMGGMGGGGNTGMIMQGGRSARAVFTEVQRSAKVEMEGGQILSGRIDLRPITVDGDLGQYSISPDKIKMIRFLKPVKEVNPADEAEGKDNPGAGLLGDGPLAAVQRQNRAAAARMARAFGGGGNAGMVPDGSSRTGAAVLTRGKVSTTTDKDVIGMIHIPTDFTLELPFGALTLAPDKLRSITFTDDHRQDKPTQAEAAGPGTPADTGRPTSDEGASPPHYLRHGSSIIVVSPVGDRVTLYNLDTKKSASLELSGSKDAPLKISLILVDNLVALVLKGPKLTQLAVADTASGTWHAQALRTPIDGEAMPIVGAGVVVYKVGRDVYAYGAESGRWDVAELPDGVQAIPSIATGTVTVEGNGHIYTFAGKTGKWDHVDVRTILDVGTEKEKK